MQAEKLGEKLKFITDNVPHRVQNIMGSNAGAGSGEFHMYRQVSTAEPSTRRQDAAASISHPCAQTLWLCLVTTWHRPVGSR